MFVKIVRYETSETYDCDSLTVNNPLQNASLGAVAEIFIQKDETSKSVILGKDSTVFCMNNEGKTIDRYSF